jgi:hypothetical protein
LEREDTHKKGPAFAGPVYILFFYSLCKNIVYAEDPVVLVSLSSS